MDRITINEFIEEVQNDHSLLKDGHDIGLIIDDSGGDPAVLQKLLSAIAARTSCHRVGIDDLTDPLGLKDGLARSGLKDGLVLIQTDSHLLPKHHEALQSLVYHHALEASNYLHSSSKRVSFEEGQRFVLVIPREALEKSWATFPLLKGILGTTISCDSTQKEVA